MKKSRDLVPIYIAMSDEQLQEEVDAMFEMIWAMLEATGSDSIESFPNPNIKLKFSCEVIKDEGRYYC